MRGVESRINAVFSEIRNVVDNMTVIACAKSLHAKLIGTEGCMVKEIIAGTTCRLTFADEGKAIIFGVDPEERRIVQKRLENKVGFSKVVEPRLLADGVVEPVVSDDRSLFVHSLDRVPSRMCGVRGCAFGDRC